MDKLQEIWAAVKVNPMSPDQIENAITQKSKGELGRFRKTLNIEMISFLFVLALGLLSILFYDEIMITLITMTITLINLILIGIAKFQLRKISIIDNVPDFINSSVKFIGFYFISFLTLVFCAGLIMPLIVKFLVFPNILWFDWIKTSGFILVLILTLVVISSLYLYAYLFYYKRRRYLKKLLKSLENK